MNIEETHTLGSESLDDWLSDTSEEEIHAPSSRSLDDSLSDGGIHPTINFTGGIGGAGGNSGLSGGMGGNGEGPRLYFSRGSSSNNPRINPRRRDLSDFRLRSVRLGDIDIVRSLEIQETRTPLACPNLKHDVLRNFHSARVTSHRRPLTVVSYDGQNAAAAKKQWEMDVENFKKMRHPNLIQMYGILRSHYGFAIIFHGDSIPYAEYLYLYQEAMANHSMRSRFSRSFNTAMNYLSTLEIDWSQLVYAPFVNLDTGHFILFVIFEDNVYFEFSSNNTASNTASGGSGISANLQHIIINGGSGGSGGRGGQHGGLGGTGQGPQIHVFGVNTWNVNMQDGANLFAHPGQQTFPLPNADMSMPQREHAADSGIPPPSSHSPLETLQLRGEISRLSQRIDELTGRLDGLGGVPALLKNMAMQLGTRGSPNSADLDRPMPVAEPVPPVLVHSSSRGREKQRSCPWPFSGWEYARR
ncbi:hypothetical protein R3P38DRAFT_3070882 [Favolaschia claudopus]|uniref:Serine-threonine/tyrosine-protein kinase catalytic domain-containing protein n=1 Tax=Favolaschia claudopus TaxID=2862362 RepID=A0AAV9ZZ57_9AGAR